MSIEKLEKIMDFYIEDYRNGKTVNLCIFLTEVIDTFKHQSNQIADLRQELSKKEDVIDVNNIKEVRRQNG